MIYPPTLLGVGVDEPDSKIFLVTENSIRINFNLHYLINENDIGHMQLRMTKLSNNSNMIKMQESMSPNGVLYLNYTRGLHYFVIDRNSLLENWQDGFLYKIQMRFGVTEFLKDSNGTEMNFAAWYKSLIDAAEGFSEWSTVLVIKAIASPQILIANGITTASSTLAEFTEPSLTPLFTGYYTASRNSKEAINQYKFDLYNHNTNDLIETSDWLLHDSSINLNSYSGYDDYRFGTLLTSGTQYRVSYSVRTVNGYELTTEGTPNNSYVFTATRAGVGDLNDVLFSATGTEIFDKENGCISLYLTTLSNNKISGNFVISRTSEKTNYQYYEDIKYLTFENKLANNEIIFRDFTVESGVRYRYAFTYENIGRYRTNPILTTTVLYDAVDLEYSYLYRDGVLLKLLFNNNMNSFKHTTLRAKQDTLGGRYPHLVENGNAYYAEFPITGLISILMDKDLTFFTAGKDGLYYKNDLILSSDRFESSDYTRLISGVGQEMNPYEYNINSDLTHSNIYIERIFREKVEEFLNTLDYKLYRSATEGNIIVSLMNVTLTPQESLGRMIYLFFATAYEVAECNLKNLDYYGIIDIGDYKEILSDNITSKSFGLLISVYTLNNVEIDVYDLIKNQEETVLGEERRKVLEKVTSLWIEPYPKTDIDIQRIALYGELSELLSVFGEQKAKETERWNEIAQELEELDKLAYIFENYPHSINSYFNINNSEILIKPGKIYALNMEINSIKLKYSPFPLLINYICETSEEINREAYITTSLEVSTRFGQIAGVFSTTSSMLEQYNYDYKDSDTYKLTSSVDFPSYNVYKEVNLYDIIKEEVRLEAKREYGGEERIGENGLIQFFKDLEYINYYFSDILSLEIEADAGTVLLIGLNPSGADAVEVHMGNRRITPPPNTGEETILYQDVNVLTSNKYILRPIDGLVRYIALKNPGYAIINYVCRTNLQVVLLIMQLTTALESLGT